MTARPLPTGGTLVAIQRFAEGGQTIHEIRSDRSKHTRCGKRAGSFGLTRADTALDTYKAQVCDEGCWPAQTVGDQTVGER